MSKLYYNSMTIEELKKFMISIDEKPFRAEQLFSSVHKNKINNIEDITVFSENTKKKVLRYGDLITVKKELELVSKNDGTIKYLFRLEDDNFIETVIMKYKYGYTACVSSQVGCRMNCSFCASGKNGLVRNLRAGEIIEQVYESERLNKISISHVVLMGSGEPLDNIDEVLKFIYIISDEKGKNLSKRNITLSTCGIIKGIERLKSEKLPITLSLSLHSADDEKRRNIMPVSKSYNINELISVLKDYQKHTGRRISFEYVLINGENDSMEDAKKLVKIIKGMKAHVNLIPLNYVREFNKEASNLKAIKEFQDYLLSSNIEVTVRRELGKDINASCGQLRNNYTEGSKR